MKIHAYKLPMTAGQLPTIVFDYDCIPPDRTGINVNGTVYRVVGPAVITFNAANGLMKTSIGVERV